MINTWPGWECVELLGEGSFGKVYKIRREEFGMAYEAALKVIAIPQNESEIRAAYEEGMDEKSVTDYFRSCVEDIVAEFALMSQLKGNSNIVSYEDHMVVQHDDGIGWDVLIRMELLTPLQSYMHSHTLEEADVIRMGIDLSRALKLCCKKRILHRDIKPENIFVSNDGDFKLGDFGVARVAEKTVAAMSKKGTYNYMAPEVYKGQEYSFSADLYSLGLVLYRLLNDNRLPYMPPAPKPILFSDKEQALNARMAGAPMPAPAHGSDALKAIVLKACSYIPEERFASPEALEQALMALLQPVSSFAVEPQKETLSDQWNLDMDTKRIQRDEDNDDDEAAFERTVSAFGSRIDVDHQKTEEKKEKPESDKKLEEIKKSEKVKKTKEAKTSEKSEKKKSGKGKKIAIALVVSLIVTAILPPVGIGLAALWITMIVIKK